MQLVMTNVNVPLSTFAVHAKAHFYSWLLMTNVNCRAQLHNKQYTVKEWHININWQLTTISPHTYTYWCHSSIHVNHTHNTRLIVVMTKTSTKSMTTSIDLTTATQKHRVIFTQHHLMKNKMLYNYDISHCL